MQKTVAFALLFVVVISPTLLVDIPAMEDYLDHLARMYILATTGTPDANPYYPIAWTLLSDIAMDLIVPQLARFVDVEVAGKLFFLASQLLVVSGAVAVELAVSRAKSGGCASQLILCSSVLSSCRISSRLAFTD